MDELRGHLALQVADRKLGPFQLPDWGTVSAGRTPGYALYLPDKWVPSKLCRFHRWEAGWVVQVGPRARMRVQNRYVGDHVFERRACVAIQEGDTLLAFPELDDWCQIDLRISLTSAVAPEVHDDHEVAGEPSLLPWSAGTRYAAGSLQVTRVQRAALGATFAYLITGQPKPTNLVKAAAELLDRSPQAVTNSLNQVRLAINKQRWGPDLETWEQLGHYLVHLTRSLNRDDLPDQLRRG